MDTSGIGSDTMLGASMLKKALDIQAQTAQTLIDSVPPPNQGMASPAQAVQVAPHVRAANPDNLGQNVDVYV